MLVDTVEELYRAVEYFRGADLVACDVLGYNEAAFEAAVLVTITYRARIRFRFADRVPPAQRQSISCASSWEAKQCASCGSISG